MTMDIQKRTETTDFYTAAVSLDSLKQAATIMVKREAQIADDAEIVVGEADLDPEKGIVVTIAVKQRAPQAPADNVASQPETSTADAPASPGNDAPAAPAVSLTIPGV